MRLKISNEIFFAQVERLIGEGEDVTIAIKGHSMRPWLRSEKERVVLRPYHAGGIEIGQIALFRYKGSHVLHRVIEIEGERVTFAGDGNINCHETATRSDIVAVAKSIITPKGRIIDCQSREWHVKSRIWQVLPQVARRVILAIMHRL